MPEFGYFDVFQDHMVFHVIVNQKYLTSIVPLECPLLIMLVITFDHQQGKNL